LKFGAENGAKSIGDICGKQNNLVPLQRNQEMIASEMSKEK
jgi:hypothetical protein